MDQALFAIPILPGKTVTARLFLQQLAGARKEEFDASERRLGLVKEVWAVQSLGQQDVYVVYFAGRNVAEALSQFAASRDKFDDWLKQRLSEITGADFSSPPPGPLSEILVDWQVK
jgi:hypothetical protein